MLTVPSGSDAGEMSAPCATVMENDCEAVCAIGEVLSVTVTVTFGLVPAAVGVPLITPVEELMLRPAGRPVAEKAYGVTPPLATGVMVHETPMEQEGDRIGARLSFLTTVS